MPVIIYFLLIFSVIFQISRSGPIQSHLLLLFIKGVRVFQPYFFIAVVTVNFNPEPNNIFIVSIDLYLFYSFFSSPLIGIRIICSLGPLMILLLFQKLIYATNNFTLYLSKKKGLFLNPENKLPEPNKCG